MKLFILAALIAISSAARLEHLEQQRGLKEYLPPHAGHHQSSFGGHGSNDFSQNGLDAGDSDAFGSAPQGVRAGSGSAGVRGLSSFEAARSNQYLPPDHGPSGSSGFNRPNAQGQDSFGASSNQFGSASQFGQNNKFGSQGSGSFPSQGSSGFGSQGSSGFGSHHGSGFGSHGSQGAHGGFGSQGSQSGFGSQGSQGSFGPQGSQGGFGSQGSQGGFGSQGSQGGFRSQGSQGGFGSQGSNFGNQGPRGQQSQLRQYLAPKSSHDNIPQQPFDEKTGYIY